ncbi:hypothetical protein KC332_g6722 [Hortaea werneckii]|uniref:Small ribosomal subunit protein uS10m n=2 Tax=Hortaea werneckii TaxID=91943 RepID=A0A3M7J870_HORWE|nr:hypothetical protein KC358_g9905 [Hortaea werneckii]OTA25605.1 hypothetical protein BTJ68_11257 [Hortaea werneckii EXF-2000]KAI6908344.1 hypothetical protein KC348_g13879 [Hortaea werneckii]KAI6922069.1 hypothetical protein KC341_g15585 [Hortaea werneckii]KAI6983989.1 hypothetical protein KC329_g8126 [Hortaea werneckii]
MAASTCSRSLIGAAKRLKLSPPTPAVQCQIRGLRQRAVGAIPPQSRAESTVSAGALNESVPAIDPATAEQELQRIRLPRAVQATYLDPLRHRAEHGITTCELQMRSYSVRNLEAFADFAMRAAYFLKLAVAGPQPLPKITERWTVPRSNFVHKKSQENFERVTVRRQLDIKDGHPEAVAAWLGFLKKHQYYGVGMKANVFEFGGLEVSKDMDQEAEKIAERLGERLDLVGGKKKLMREEHEVQSMIENEPFKAAYGAYSAMGGAQSVPHANHRMERHVVGGRHVVE